MDGVNDDGENDRPQFGNRFLTDPQNVFQHNAWDNVVWDEEQEEAARSTTLKQLKEALSPEEYKKYEEDADHFWDKFYSQHQNKFFKDRNWLFTEFPELYVTSSDPKHASARAKLTSPAGQNEDQEQSELSNLGAAGGATDKSAASDHSSASLLNTVNSTCTEVDLQPRGQESISGMRVVGREGAETALSQKSQFCMLEVGCGVGNTVFPLLQTNSDPGMMVYCCDFSSTAIDIVKEHTLYDPARCHAFVWDITDTKASLPFPPASLDIITLIFVISALSPEKMQESVNHLASLLKPGGQILFRDYGRYDMAQLRFKKGRCLGENFYVRGDGTRVYFFTQEEVRAMFTEAGLVEEQNLVDRRLQVNRGRQLKMYRVWLQCKYCRPAAEASKES